MWMNLDDPLSLETAGSKAFQLHRLRKMNVRAPSGFVLPSTILAQLLSDAQVLGWQKRLAGMDTTTSMDDFDAMANDVNKVIQALVLPDSILRHLETLSFDSPWVVRSSAIGEDGLESSFAGQLSSVLHISDVPSMVHAIRCVWASAWSAPVLFYQCAMHVQLQGVAVLIQPQIDPVCAGVMFTRSPLDGASSVMIEWTPGLAEALVQGEVNPYRVVIDPAGVQTGDALVCADALIALVDPLEQVWGPGLDIEWTWDGQLTVVQLRHMTRGVARGYGLEDGQEMRVWSNANMVENYPDPISPMLYSVARRGYTHYFKNLGKAFGIQSHKIEAVAGPLQSIVGVHQGRLYYNLSHVHKCLLSIPFGATLAQDFNGFLGIEADAQVKAPGVLSRSGAIVDVVRMMTTTMASMSRIEPGIERFEQRVDGFARRYHHAHHATVTSNVLLEGYLDFMAIRTVDWVDASLADALTTISLGLLRRLLAQVDADQLLGGLLEGADNLISAEPVKRLRALAQSLMLQPSLLRALVRGDEAFFESRSSHASFFEQFDAYLDDVGFRVSGELMLTVPSLQEKPAVVVALLRSYVKQDLNAKHDPLVRFKETMQQLKSRMLAVHGVARGHLVWPVVVKVVGLVHRAIALRERARFKQALLYYRFRRLLISMGGRLVQANLLQCADDVFFLEYEELRALFAGDALYPTSYVDIVETRRKVHAAQMNVRTPRVVRLSQGHYWTAHARSDEDAEIEHAPLGLRVPGQVASGGAVQARARVLDDVSQVERLVQGDILVARQTDPGWGPLFYMASGLILERGGLLSHGAILARELGIPALVGVEEAATWLADAPMVLMAQGFVTRLDEQQNEEVNG